MGEYSNEIHPHHCILLFLGHRSHRLSIEIRQNCIAKFVHQKKKEMLHAIAVEQLSSEKHKMRLCSNACERLNFRNCEHQSKSNLCFSRAPCRTHFNLRSPICWVRARLPCLCHCANCTLRLIDANVKCFVWPLSK